MDDKTFNFTKAKLDGLPLPVKDRETYFDKTVKELQLRITIKGTKSFVLTRRVNNKIVRVTLGRYPAMTIDQARTEARKQLGLMVTGIDPNKAKKAERAKGTTLGQCLEDYLSIRASLAENTKKGYRSMVNNHLSDWKNKPLKDIDRDMVAIRHKKIIEGGEAIAANNVMRCLRALFNFAHGQYEDEHGKPFFTDNPVTRISHTRAWAPETRRKTILRASELPLWIQAVEALRASDENHIDASPSTVADYLEFCLFSGLRRDDVLSLKWEQIELDTALMHPVIHKKQSEVITLPLSDYLVVILKKRAQIRVNEYVFAGRGGQGRFDEPKRQIAKVVKISGIQFSSHDLRRTFISVAESLDISTYAIKRLCTHSLGGDVTAGYIQMDVERLRAPMQKITDYFLKAMGKTDTADVVNLLKQG
ncbi:tyrosine-type recombinase/integrase [Agitococcus lubricus]|uniref:Site-specific recombinase XerD n=1 Tax=Agitococcus lubricus TaxID=1077255 RepID=A0A2T5IT73_9GAMM|nr:integrase arm-type DNA-binding domain-containing protein [Agitococcus lubricus]PTQ87057.1 site-specific recombinase XerD [Agitococcus lubricus]